MFKIKVIGNFVVVESGASIRISCGICQGQLSSDNMALHSNPEAVEEALSIQLKQLNGQKDFKSKKEAEFLEDQDAWLHAIWANDAFRRGSGSHKSARGQ